MNSTLSGRLTDKELRVAFLVARGLTNKAIGEKLGTTEQVIKNYLRNVFDQLGFFNRVELAMYVAKELQLAEENNTAILPRLPQRSRGTNATARAN